MSGILNIAGSCGLLLTRIEGLQDLDQVLEAIAKGDANLGYQTDRRSVSFDRSLDVFFHVI